MTSTNLKTYKNQRGIALVMSLIMLLVITILGVSAVKMSTLDTQVAGNTIYSSLVFQGAESALGKVKADGDWFNINAASSTRNAVISVPDSYFNPAETVNGGVTLNSKATIEYETTLDQPPMNNEANSSNFEYSVLRIVADSKLTSTSAHDRHSEGVAAQKSHSADDIDLISAEQIAYDANVLLIMDVSGSMEWGLTSDSIPANPADNRLSTLQTALSALLSDPEMVNINFGLSSFAGDTTVDSYSQTAHGISYPVSPIDADAETILDQNPLFDHPGTSFLPPTTPGQKTRDYLQTISNTWVPYGGTPIVDSLFEAALYFRGLPTNWGKHDPSKIRAAHPSTYVGLLEDSTVSTTAFQCNSLPCSGASCNASKTCSTVTSTNTCNTPTCGDVCTGPSTTTETCPDGVTSCGNGTNCTSQVETVTRDCITNSEFLCLLVHPTWYDCNTVTETSCTTTCPDGIVDEFGVCQNPVNQCSDSEHKQCKEDINQYSCDADVYQCTSDVESCQHEVCNNQTTNTTVLSGSAVFVSPIKEECPANGIILLSDGAPTVNLSADLVSDMIGAGYSNSCTADASDMGRCGEELATYLASEDNNTSISGDQFVNTFTVGLSLQNKPTAEAYLKSLAKAGNGEFINASNPTDLVDAFKLAIEGIVATRARSFSAPTYSINTTNQLSHDNIVYIPMFDRKGVVWPGNLKKYQIENGVLKDADGNAATDSDGTLLKTARDLWSSVASEDAVKSGGAANKIVPSSRNVFTDDGS
ncbi:hypothetical protein GQR58_006656 [Nymphon striatum]|nr:hypothetical protein GQR58_006656 [Nymphon striatum]